MASFFGNKILVYPLAGALIASAGISTSAQKPPKEAPPAPPVVVTVPGVAVSPRPKVVGIPHERLTTEKRIAVDPNVNIKFCVLEGKVKVNGWQRDEVRLFVRDGSRAGFKVLEKDPGSSKPIWLLIANVAGPQAVPAAMSECMSGEYIELDVPMTATLDISGRVTATTVDSVKKVKVKNIGGNIMLRNIPGGITAATYEGDVTVENSGGAINLDSSSGNIVAFEVGPGQIGDLFRAKTRNGSISLQRLEHRQIEANSISGSLLFDGKLLNGGLYNFNTENGSIKLVIPEGSSAKIVASYGFGSFNSEIPLKYLYQNETSTAKSLGGLIGAGDATVKLTTSRGSIGIRRP